MLLLNYYILIFYQNSIKQRITLPMKIYTDTISLTTKSILPNHLTKLCPLENILFFDIETTGLSADRSVLYLIGVLFITDNQIHIKQWFNENGLEEETLLSEFNSFCKSYTHLIHYNGLGFDIPYLKQKAKHYHINLDHCLKLQQIDIYKEIKPFKHIFDLENMKQTSIEQFLGITREDRYSGKELIEIYKKYVVRPSNESEQLLLLHNHDDLLGMPKISSILSYLSYFNNLEIEEIIIELDETSDVKKANFHITHPASLALPKRIMYSTTQCYLNTDGTTTFLSVSLYDGCLHHFFEDYKNYYYLPQEDMAIHKSVATYVESGNRIKATKNNCYIKKTGLFLPLTDDILNLAIFKEDAKDKCQFILYDDLNKCDMNVKKEYLRALIAAIIKKRIQ